MNKTIDIISLGCSKNLVDSEVLMGLMEANGYQCTHDSEDPQGDIVVVNTCGFINDAKEESINTILEFAQAKTEGRIEKLFVMGCLSERYLADLEKEIPEVDGWYGKFNYKKLLQDLAQNFTSGPDPSDKFLEGKRHITTPRHYAYVKISEGCDRHCAYCAIPLITGRHQSRPMQEILDEVRQLVKDGTKEFNVIAQELTLLRVMREKPNVCKYLDIALQHISDNMLQRMQRHVTKAETYDLIERMRREVPGIHIRTTLMVGFPGETEDDFEELKTFVKWARFERMGAFAYSEEEGTYSEKHYEDDVPEDVKQHRLDKLMRIQQNISAELEAGKVGQVLKVIIDRQEGDYYIGRTEFCSPEVDPEVLIPVSERKLTIGTFYQVEITDSEEFDLYGTTIN